ncbi:MAG: magnesium/cobalt transporter CorA [Petrimonas sp.]|nr:magnesium/cobalt transporter CorA [Petrimonas sp.]
MPYIPLKRKEDLGHSPYEMKFRGQRKEEEVLMTVINISSESVVTKEINDVEELRSYKDSGSITWLNIDGLHDEKLMTNVAEIFHIPSDIMSDVMDPQLRAQVEEFDEGLFISVKMLEFNEKSGQIVVDNISILVMNNMLISFQEKQGDVFDPVRDRIRKHTARFINSGVDYLAFALLDVIIDNYIYILGVYGEKVETFEEKITLSVDKRTLRIINVFKHELNNLRRDIKPAKEMILSLVKLDTDYISEENQTHYKELQDNINQATEMLDYYREVLYDSLDVYHSSMSTKLNDIMALLTVYSVVFIPLTFIVGVYGMNFDHMPELHTRNGYFVVWGIMIVIALAMLWYFKRKKWF